MKRLIVFFSRNGENYGVGNIEIGNAKVIAMKIKEYTNADIFEIKRDHEYPKDYKECTNEALQELNANAYPKLKSNIDISDYNLIYLCYPNWWGTYPRVVATFLKEHDFTGKIIMPMCTHEGSKMGSSISDLKKALPKAIIKNGLAIRGIKANNCDEELKEWILNE